jgi:hypothetical protein
VDKLEINFTANWQITLQSKKSCWGCKNKNLIIIFDASQIYMQNFLCLKLICQIFLLFIVVLHFSFENFLWHNFYLFPTCEYVLSLPPAKW